MPNRRVERPRAQDVLAAETSAHRVRRYAVAVMSAPFQYSGMTKRIHARRHHSEEFRRSVCGRIRSGEIGRREAQRLYRLSDNLLHRWLRIFDEAGQGLATGSADDHADCRRRIEMLERKVGQLTMALEGRAIGDAASDADYARRLFSQAKKSSPGG